MKRTIISLLVFVGMFIVGAVPNAQAGDDHGCSNASLQGAYGFYSTGSLVPAGTPRVSVGRRTFDGNGNTFAAATVNDNGTVTHSTGSGTYSVNADCSGTLLLSGGNAEIVLVDGGKEFYTIRPGGPAQVVYLVGKKQFPDRDEASCSNATLKGTYGGYTTGTVVPAGTPRVVLRRETFDGKGSWSNTLTVNDNGTVTHGSFSGTYTVNADCTVTFGANAVGVLVDGGKELYFISTGSISQRVTYTVDKKQFPEDDDEQ